MAETSKHRGKFFTFFGYGWDEVLVSGYEDGKKFNRKIDYKPFLFQTSQDGDYLTAKGVSVKKRHFNSISHARKFANQFEDAQNTSLFGLTNYPYVYIYENYKEMDYDPSLLRVGNTDIETDSENGFGSYSKTQVPDREIISITLKLHGENTVYVLGLKPYATITPELLERVKNGLEIVYKQCESEKHLLLEFITLWRRCKIDVITTWNGNAFDIPYIIKRIEMVLSEEHTRRLSPFNKIEKTKIVNQWGQDLERYEIVGIPSIDYMEAYKKFSFTNEESYSLNYICGKILKLSKLDYSEYGSLARLYKQNHDMFIDYNIIDVLRVEQLDDFLKFIAQIVMIAHFAKVNFVDTFGTIRTWDIMIHNYLMDQKIVVPMSGSGKKDRQIAGGFVKEPKPGRYPYVMSYDLTSLYPHLIMQYNISPETLLGSFDPIAGEFSVEKILKGEMAQYRDDLLKENVTVSGKGTVFSRDKMGFLPKLMKDLFVQRKEFKGKMLGQEKLLQEIKAEIAKRGL